MPTPDAPYRSPKARARFTVAMLALGIAVALAGIVAAFVDRALFAKANTGPGAVSQERLELSDSISAGLGFTQLAVFAVTIVAFLIWFHRVNANLPALGLLPRYSPVWAVGMWFVPVLAWFLPKRATNDAWRAGTDQEVPMWIHLWWALWLIDNVLGRLVFRSYRNADTFPELRSAATVDVWAYAVDSVTAALAIGVVIAVTRRQDERAAAGLLPGPPPPPGQHAPLTPAVDGSDFTIQPGWKRAPEPQSSE